MGCSRPGFAYHPQLTASVARELEILGAGKGRVRVDHSKCPEKCPRLVVNCTRATGTVLACLFCPENCPRGTGTFYERASDLNSTSQVANEQPELGPREHQYCITTARYYCAHWNQTPTNSIRSDSVVHCNRIEVSAASVLNRYSRILAAPQTLS